MILLYRKELDPNVGKIEIAFCINDPVIYMNSPLHMAVFKGHMGIINMLMEQQNCKKDIKTSGRYDDYLKCSRGTTALGIACKQSGINKTNISIVKYLLEHACDATISNIHGMTPLFQEIDSGNYETVKILLESGQNLSICLKNGDSAFIYAVKRGTDVSILRTLQT